MLRSTRPVQYFEAKARTIKMKATLTDTAVRQSELLSPSPCVDNRAFEMLGKHIIKAIVSLGDQLKSTAFPADTLSLVFGQSSKVNKGQSAPLSSDKQDWPVFCPNCHSIFRIRHFGG
jgi:hypothetical protein